MLGEQFTVLASGEGTGSYEVFDQVVPPGAGPPLHSHDWDEAFYVLQGELVFRTGEKKTHAPAGTFGHFPAGTPHAFASQSGRAIPGGSLPSLPCDHPLASHASASQPEGLGRLGAALAAGCNLSSSTA